MIALIFVGDLKYCPYIKKYIEMLENEKKSFRVYFWNRGNYSINTKYDCKYFEHKSELAKSKFKKFADFKSYSTWLNREIKKDAPDKIIFLSTLSIMLMRPSLLRKYYGKYILDIRDYSYEKFWFFRKLEQQYIQKSYFCCISSPGFENFLIANYPYQIVHNFDKTLVDSQRKFKKKMNEQTLKVVWTGVMRYFDYQKQLIDALGNDNRFELHYYGDGPELDKYIDYAHSFTNVVIHGSYDNDQKCELLEGADIINNCYGSSNKRLLEYAISNKYYDGVIFKIPQIVEADNYKARVVEDNGLGISIHLNDEHFANSLFTFYHSVDEAIFNRNCDRVLTSVLIDDERYENSLRQFIAE